MKILGGILILACGVAYADCNISIVNKSNYPVTFAGVFKSESGVVNNLPWVTVAAKSKFTQGVDGLDSCNVVYKYSESMALGVQLKNSTGLWVGDKGFLYGKDSSYAKVSSSGAKSDTNQSITLSNGLDVTEDTFNIRVCDALVTSDECN